MAAASADASANGLDTNTELCRNGSQANSASLILIDQRRTERRDGDMGCGGGGSDVPIPPDHADGDIDLLGMIPIAATIFWGPMAYAIMGGVLVATLLTPPFLPPSTWFGFGSSSRALIKR